MFENKLQTRCAICGTGVLLGLIFVLAHLPLLLLMFPVTVLFLGIVADPDETHAVWYGMLNTLGIFDVATLSDAEAVNYLRKNITSGSGRWVWQVFWPVTAQHVVGMITGIVV